MFKGFIFSLLLNIHIFSHFSKSYGILHIDPGSSQLETTKGFIVYAPNGVGIVSEHK
jgi:hypothetical protein